MNLGTRTGYPRGQLVLGQYVWLEHTRDNQRQAQIFMSETQSYLTRQLSRYSCKSKTCISMVGDTQSYRVSCPYGQVVLGSRVWGDSWS